MTYTKGPWVIDRWSDKQGSKGISIKSAAGLHIANMVMQLDDAEPANARLIAAAPDLMEALKNLLSWSERITEFHGAPSQEAARAAARKAEGKS